MHADRDVITAAREGEFLDDIGQFFAPTSTDMVDGLVAGYRQDRARIEAAAAFINGPECACVLNYFLDGNSDRDRGRMSLSSAASKLFQEEGAVAALNSKYWSKALALTDVYDAMPQDRRNQWNAVIDGQTAPDFEEEAVRATLLDLLNSRAKFLAERVDGIFRALSGSHVTNCPEGFGRRMIIAHLITSYGTTNTDRVGYINDLRCVIAKFMGRDEPSWNATSGVVGMARQQRRGEWVTLDGGALRLRAYKCGTAHLEVHPDMAWRLNCVLAHLYPLAIPSQFRQRPKKNPKDFVMMGRPLPFRVVEALSGLEEAYLMEKNTGPQAWRQEFVRKRIRNGLQLRYGRVDDNVLQAEIDRVMAYLGGVKTENDRRSHYYAFDYDAHDVVAEVVASGCIPDQKSHQFYPTPPSVAQAVIEAAQIGPEHMCLEPSAGTGALASLMPKDRTTCIEISALHCAVLTARGYCAVQADFLKIHERQLYDRIVMNPPFADGRAQAHTEHAYSLLKTGGRLVAVLPASMRGRDFLPGVTDWSRTYDNEFAGTSVSVTIMTATKQ
ncbi:DUF4942 domain-containing protein [Methyloversatilis sp. XJ19-49]|uniref:DUF4942 domain-containing protein n=1 Tax=Methyloversatilis sp. XJ19-49 TaxID=2963429 RepID=UPI00211C17D5|nr:DUF4942 domain-containing protein [Methyloversatilis sp. XJ19-49]MCQ9378841.1 DUF4942 domain-containing protein [Methyloversatilis sp. XJ19-49]